MNLNLSEPVSAKDVVQKSFDRIKKRSDGDFLTGITSGFWDLDSITGGLEKSQLVVVAARPSMGKSAFCLNIVRHSAIENKIPTAIFALSSSNEIVIQRLLVTGSEIDSNRVRTGYFKPDDWEKLNAEVRSIEQSPLFLHEDLNTIEKISHGCRNLKRCEEGLRLVLVEDINELQDCFNPSQFSNIGERLKALAVELDITILATAPISRAVEGRRSKRPLLSDVEFGIGDGNGADVVLCLYRDEYYDPETKNRGKAEVIIRKNRFGPVGTVDLDYDGSISRFKNVSHINWKDDSD